MNPRIPNFVKIRPFGGDLLNTDGQTDMTKLMVGFFAIFANAPKNVCHLHASSRKRQITAS